MLIDSYRSMIVRFASSATRVFSHCFFLSLAPLRLKKTSGTRVGILGLDWLHLGIIYKADKVKIVLWLKVHNK